MQDLLAKKVVGLTDLRQPGKVIKEARGEPVAIMNRNEVAGYFVPASAVNRLGVETMAHAKAMTLFRSRQGKLAPGLEYLKDK